MDTLLTIALMAGIYVAFRYVWKRQAMEAVERWCETNGFEMVKGYPVLFFPHRQRSRLTQVVSDGAALYRCSFEVGALGLGSADNIKLLSQESLEASASPNAKSNGEAK